MRVFLLGVVAWACAACSLVKTSSSTTTPSGTGGETTTTTTSSLPDSSTSTTTTSSSGPSAEYSGPDAYWVQDFTNKSRLDVEELMHEHHPQGKLVETGDTDPQYARDELVCDQSPKFGKVAPTATITVKYCNTYKKPNEGPTLVGLTVAAAKQKAVAAGFTGKIEVGELYDFDASCKEGNVCRVEPIRWYLNQDREMRLMVNKKVSISTPDE